MGRLTNSGYIALRDCPAIVYELTGVNRCAKSVFNWAAKGRADQHGDTVKLRWVKRLGLRYTRREWLNEFIEAVG